MFVQEMYLRAVALVDRPIVLEDFRQYRGDAGRRRVMAGEVDVAEWERQSARLVTRLASSIAKTFRTHVLTLPKAQRREYRLHAQPVVDFVCSEGGRDQIQDTIQYSFDKKPAHIPSGDPWELDNAQTIVCYVADILSQASDSRARQEAQQRADGERPLPPADARRR